MFRSKPLEERLAATIKSELAGSAADLEGRRREYHRRFESKKEARAALEDAEAETRRLHSEMLALKKGFWEAYYGNGRDTLTGAHAEAEGSLERAIEEAEKSLKRARTKFEEADFDEVSECSALLAEADAVEEEANRQLDTIEGTLEELVAELRRDLREAGRALREECQGAQGVSTPTPSGEPQSPARPPQAPSMPRMRRWLTKASTREPGGRRNLPVAAFFVLVGLFCLWVGLFEIKGEVPLALVLVGTGFMEVATAALYALPTDRLRTSTRAWIASISLTLAAVGVAAWVLLT
jgi:hypothetical protein